MPSVGGQSRKSKKPILKRRSRASSKTKGEKKPSVKKLGHNTICCESKQPKPKGNVIEYNDQDYSVFAPIDFIPETRIYYPHDNGGRPWKVCLTGNQCEVWKGTWDENIKDDRYDTKLFSKQVNRFWNGFDAFAGWVGCAILMQVDDPKDNQYIFAGRQVFQFQLKDDKICYFHSNMGNNDVPYPVAYGEKNIYRLDAEVEYFPISSIPERLGLFLCPAGELLNPFRAEYVVSYIYGHLPKMIKKNPRPKMIPIKIKLLAKRG